MVAGSGYALRSPEESDIDPTAAAQLTLSGLVCNESGLDFSDLIIEVTC